VNIKRVMVWGQFAGGIAVLALGIGLLVLISGASRVRAKGLLAGILCAFGGPVMMITSYQRGCARCRKALTETNLLFPIEQLDGIKQDVQNGTASTLMQPQPINRQLPRFACVKGAFCAGCGDVALVEVGEHAYSRPNDERSGKFIAQLEKKEVTGPTAQAIKRMSAVVATG